MIKKKTLINCSLLLSFLGAFLLQFSQMTTMCYYVIYPVAILFIIIAMGKQHNIARNREFACGAILLVFLGYSFVFGSILGTSMGVLYWGPYVYLAIVLIFVTPQYFGDLPKMLFSILVLIGFLQSIGIILQVFQHDLWQSIVHIYMSDFQVQELVKREFDGYFSGFSTEVAVSAFYIAWFVLICFFKNWFLKHWINFNTIFVILGFYSIILTSKRAHLLFLVLSIIIGIVIANMDRNIVRRWSKYLIIIIISIIAFSYLVQYVSEESSIGRLLNLFEGLSGGEKSLDELSTGRMSFWILAIELFKKKPLFGIGWCNFYKHNVFRYHAHNTYLQVLCETGVLGFFFYLLFLIFTLSFSIRVIKRCVMLRRRDYLQIICPAFGIQCFYLLYSITGNTLYDYWYFWAYCVGTILSSLIWYRLVKYTCKVQRCDVKR